MSRFHSSLTQSIQGFTMRKVRTTVNKRHECSEPISSHIFAKKSCKTFLSTTGRVTRKELGGCVLSSSPQPASLPTTSLHGSHRLEAKGHDGGYMRTPMGLSSLFCKKCRFHFHSPPTTFTLICAQLLPSPANAPIN